ncbi:hypothetical protein KAX02_07950 [candidate division WOR-3 bacterium]|nr:hypothetical protein [candidate division WOR-3 bacterium]
MEEKEFRTEREKIETDKRMSFSIVDDFLRTIRKKLEANIREALTETKNEINVSILNRYKVEMKILKDRRERERRRR